VSAPAAHLRRDRLRHEARRAILDATEALLVEEGYERFSMRRLAERCGYTAPTLYHYFADKSALLDELLEERFALLHARLGRVPHSNDPVARFRELVHCFVRFGQEHPTHYRLLMTPRDDGSEPPAVAEQARELMEAPLRELAARGRLAGGDAEAVSQSFWALCHGLISLRSARPDWGWSPRLEEVAVQALLEGTIAGVRAGREETS
jgi:AcrR family transcriptional regulator